MDSEIIELIDTADEAPNDPSQKSHTAESSPIKLIPPEKLMPRKRRKHSGLKTIECKNDEPVLSLYARKKLLVYLRGEFALGNPDQKGLLALKLNYSDSQGDKVAGFIESQARQGAKNADLDNNDEAFVQISEWIKFLYEKNMNGICGNELPLLFKLIANLEDLPNPEEIGDINLHELYIFLSNIMLGYPAHTPTGATGKFLEETFKSIIDEIDTNTTVNNMSLFEKHLKNSTLIAGPSVEDFNLEELRLILCNSSTNPFNFPFEFLKLNNFENVFPNIGDHK